MSCSAVLTPALSRLVFGFVSHHVMIIDPDSQRCEGRNIILIVITLVITPTPFRPCRSCHNSVHTPLNDIKKKHMHTLITEENMNLGCRCNHLWWCCGQFPVELLHIRPIAP